MNEKRNSKRTPVELAASAGVDGTSINDNLEVKDISQGGFCFQSERPVEAGTDIKLAVELGGKDSIAIKVRSVWCQKNVAGGNYLIGVQIVDTKGKDIEKFLQFYDQKADQE